MKLLASTLLALLVFVMPTKAAEDPLAAQATGKWPPEGTVVKLPVSADTWVACDGKEGDGSNGGAQKFKLKGRQECSLFDVDTSPLKGKIITGAIYRFHTMSPDAPALRVTVSSVATPWVEGTGNGYEVQPGSACYNSPALGKASWTYPGSTFMDAAFGRGHTIWRFADATPPDDSGWQSVAVDADVVAARAAGLSHGFGIYDDIGCTWSYDEGKFTYNLYPNRFFHSKDSRQFVPYLEVWVAGTDSQAPEAVGEQGFAVETKDLPAGEAVITWKTPADKGGGKTLGFQVAYKEGPKTGQMPRYLVPMAAKPGQSVRMHIQDVPFGAGQEIELAIRPVDSAGNVGPVFTRKVTLSATPRVFAIAENKIQPFGPSIDLPEVGGLKVAVLDLVDKVEARTGKMIPEHPEGYKGGNHLWSGKEKLVCLQAARNEHVSFQVNLEGKSQGVTAKLAFADDKTLRPAVYRFDYVKTKAGNVPDVVVPLPDGPLPIPARDDPEAAAQTNCSLLCEVYVPHQATGGKKTGTLTLASAGQTLQLKVELTVWDFTLPNRLSWVPEMNAYGSGETPAQCMPYYRLAHEHRSCLTQLHYHWNGRVDFEPKVQDGQVDWTTWARQFGPLFDGSAFRGMPRAGEPVDRFYLPFNENWPLDYYKHYTKSYWPEQAFSEEYKAGMQKAFTGFAQLADGKGWHDTQFWFFLNGKVYNKRGNWNKGISTWVLDEPRDVQDFWALRWYGVLFHQAVGPVKGKAKLWYRADVSYSPWGRNLLWGVCDMECVGGSTPQKVRMKQDEQVLWGKSTFTQYGSANHPQDANIQPVVWSLTSWANGSLGVVAWSTIAGAKNWSEGSETAVLYPRKGEVLPSVRLKAFRQGQQMVEYLTLLGDAYSQPHFAVAAGMSQIVDLKGTVHKSYEDDAGTIHFEKADPVALWALRCRVGQMISAKKPAYRPCVRPMPEPDTGVGNLPDIGYVRTAPPVAPARPG